MPKLEEQAEIKKQSEEQFAVMYGDKAQQSSTCRAGFDVLFGGSLKSVAAEDHGVTRQGVYRFLQQNETKHIARCYEEARQPYLKAASE